MKTIDIKEFKQLFYNELWEVKKINNYAVGNLYCFSNGYETSCLCIVTMTECIMMLIDFKHINLKYDSDGNLYQITFQSMLNEFTVQKYSNNITEKEIELLNQIKEQHSLPF